MSTPRVTPEEVKAAMIAASITHVDHHDCGGCGVMVFYSREGEQLFFNPACDCSSHWSPREPRPWSDAAAWINIQSDPKWRSTLRVQFGLQPEAPGPNLQKE